MYRQRQGFSKCTIAELNLILAKHMKVKKNKLLMKNLPDEGLSVKVNIQIIKEEIQFLKKLNLIIKKFSEITLNDNWTEHDTQIFEYERQPQDYVKLPNILQYQKSDGQPNTIDILGLQMNNSMIED